VLLLLLLLLMMVMMMMMMMMMENWPRHLQSVSQLAVLC